ncbi:MAG: protein kinase domain-containing protein [Blastocatellia bacterium]
MPDLQLVEQIYHEARGLPKNEQPAFLDSACANDEPTRREVESLLAARNEGGDFLEVSDIGKIVPWLESGDSHQIARQLDSAPWRDLLRECAACGECGDGETEICPRCGAPLATLLPVERTVAGRYRIERRIGKGGMGTVYRATDLSLRRPVALKVLSAAFIGDKTAQDRFEREARAAARLHHPNVVRIYDHGTTLTGGAWLAMEYVEGMTLREEMKRNGQLPLSDVCVWFEQIAAGIKAAHDAGVIHRDLKPENIMLVDAPGKQPQACILDFGLARLLKTDVADDVAWSDVRNLTAPGLLIGTPAYMAPEQFRSEADERTDIFVLGVMLVEMLTGQHPFQRGNYQDTKLAITEQPYHLAGTATVRRLDEALQKCLAKNPGQRYARMNAVQDELLPLLRACPPELRASPHKQRHEQLRILRSPWLIAAVVFGLIVGWYVWHLLRRNLAADLTGALKTALVADWKHEEGYGHRLSPDEQKVAFVKSENGQTDVFVKPLKGGESVRLTNDAWVDAQPLWSPDGGRLIYFSTRNNKQEVWVIPGQGGAGELVKVLSEQYLEFVRWSQDGRRIFYGTACDLYALDLQTREINRLTNFEQGKCKIHDLAISQDERWIAYPDTADGASHIWAKLIDGGTPIRVTQADEENGTPLWAPDGQRVIYSCKRDGVKQICAGYLDGRAPAQLTFGSESITPLHVTADGQRILYRKANSADSTANLFRFDLRERNEVCLNIAPTVELSPTASADKHTIAYQRGNQSDPLSHTIWVKESPYAPVMRLTTQAFDPRWSPQGQQLAFLRSQGDSTSLWTINGDGTQERAVVKENVLFGGLRDQPFHWLYPNNYCWSPDGNRLAYISNPAGVSNLWTIGSTGDGAQNLTSNVDSAIYFVSPFWSPDGRRITYLSHRQTPSRLWNISVVEAGQAHTLYQTDQRLRLLGWTQSNDGQIFARLGNNTSSQITDVQLARLNIKTGKVTSLTTLSATYFVSTLLAPNGEQVAFTRRENDRDELWVVSLATAQASRLRVSDSSSAYFAGLAWSPDSNAIYFSKQSNSISLWAIENFR